MLKHERQTFILELLQKEGAVRVSELATQLDVNPVTVRRDLTEMEVEGCLHRVHGGAVRREKPLPQRQATGLERRIAEAAVRFIPDESVVFLSPGTLTPELVPFLGNHQHLTVVTNALDVAWSVARLQQHTLHVLGGQVTSDYGIYGDTDALRRVRADWIVLEAGGLDAERGLTHDDHDFTGIARDLINLSAQVMVLLPPDRVGRAGALFVAPPGEVDVLVTGREASNPPLWDLSELGIRIVLT